MDNKKYDLTVYTYDRDAKQHDSEEVYLDSMDEVKAKVGELSIMDNVCFMELYTYNESDDCYDFTERYERPDNSFCGMERDEIISRLEALRTYCDISASDATAELNGDVADIFIKDVETLDAVLEMLREGELV